MASHCRTEPRIDAEPLGLRHHQYFYAAGCVLLVEDLLGGLLEVFRFGRWNVGEGLRVAIGERKP